MMSKATDQHRQQARGKTACCGVLTISDTRTPGTDKGGQLVCDLLTQAGHTVHVRGIVKDEPTQIRQTLSDWLADPAVDLICTTGGTGIAPRDTTVEVVEQMIDRPLPGFGELFRMLSWEQVGPAAMLSRAVAGLAGRTMIFTMPGSTNAVELAMTRLIVPELSHLIWEQTGRDG